MNTPLNVARLVALAMAGLSFSAMAADNFSVYRICEDQRVIKTSDGADAGHIEFIVVDPSQQRIVSTVITGGVVGERHVSVPFSEFQVVGEREMVLNQITRERIVAAPVIEVDGFRKTSFIEPSFIEKSSTYFQVNGTPEREKSHELRDPGVERQLPQGERRNDPRNGGRDERERAPQTGNVRDNQQGEQPRGQGEPLKKRGQTGNSSESADKQTREPAPAPNARDVENRPPQESREEKARTNERVEKNASPETNRSQGATAKDKKEEGSPKSEKIGGGETKKQGATKEDKGERKEPKGEEQR